MKVALVYPPTCDPTAPYLAVPMLAGFLRAHGVDVLPIDANLEAFDALLEPAPLSRVAERVERGILSSTVGLLALGFLGGGVPPSPSSVAQTLEDKRLWRDRTEDRLAWMRCSCCWRFRPRLAI